MPTGGANAGLGLIDCPLCGITVDTAVEEHCPQCGMDTRDKALAEIVKVDKTWDKYASQYATLVGKWDALRTRREALIEKLMASRIAGDAAATQAPAQAAASAPSATASAPAPGSSDPWTVPSGQSGREPEAKGLTLKPAPGAPIRRTPRRLTAPNMLGISGAALLITSAIVFIAVTWDTFPPGAQGVVVLAVGSAIAILATWLHRHDLPVSGGAVAVVAMGFVGLSLIAFDRGTGALGDYTTALAALAAFAAGVGLSRLGLAWVAPTSAAALLLAATAASIAFAANAGDFSNGLTLAGAVTGGAALAAYPLWQHELSRGIVRWGGSGLVTLAAMPTVAGFIGGAAHRIDWGEAAIGMAPVAVLGVAGYFWPRVAVPPAVAVLTLNLMSIGVDLALSLGWLAGAAAAVAIAAILLARVSEPWRIRVALGSSLGLLVVGFGVVWTGVASLVQLVSRYDANPVVDLGYSTGIAALGAALALWLYVRSRDGWETRAVAVTGALAGVVGPFALAVGASDAQFQGQLEPLILLLTAAAAIGGVSVLAWRTRGPRLTAGIAAVVTALFAGFVAVVAVTSGDLPLGTGLALGAIPLAGLVAAGIRWPRTTLAPATLLATALGAAVPASLGEPGIASVATAAAVAAVVAWIAALISARAAAPAMLGAAPALVVAVLAATFISAIAVAALLGSADARAIAEEFPGLAWLSVIDGALLIAALAGWRSRAHARVSSSAVWLGAFASVAIGVLVAATVGDNLATDVPLSAAITTGAFASAALIPLWWHRPARRAIGMGATAWLAIGQLAEAIHVADGTSNPADAALIGAVAVAALIAFSAWWPEIALAPAVVVVAAMASSVAWEHTHGLAAWLALAVATTAALWAAALLPRRFRTPLWVGAAPGSVAVAGFVVVSAFAALSFGEVDLSQTTADGWWHGGALVVAFAGLMAVAPLRPYATWLSIPFAIAVAGLLGAPLAWILLAAAAVSFVVAGDRVRSADPAAGVYFALAIAWAAGDQWSAAIVLAVVAGAAVLIARRSKGTKQDLMLVIAAVASAVAAGLLASAGGANQGVAAAIGVAAGLIGAFVVERTTRRGSEATRVIVGAVTVVGPFAAGAPGWAGTVLLLVTAAWLALAFSGWTPARYLAAGSVSLGFGLLAYNAGASLVEAYTLAPAVAALAVGAWWLVEDSRARTFLALGPGLAIGLLPSVFALASNPDHLGRTLGLLAATIALALWGVLARWFAPILGTLVTAGTVSLTQLAAGSELVPRWGSIGIVGVLLLVVAATYEKLKELR